MAHNPQISQIGANVARYRKAAGMSAEALAQAAGAGLTRAVLSNLEHGRKDDVTVTQLLALAHALRVPPVALIVDVFNPGAEAGYGVPVPDAQNAQVIEWISGNLPHPDADEGVPLNADKALSTLRSYVREWQQWEWARGLLIKARAEGDDEEEQDAVSFAVDVADSAARWIEQLHHFGISAPNALNKLRQGLLEAGVKHDPGLTPPDHADLGF